MDLNNIKVLVCDDSILARKQLKDAIKANFDGAIFFEASNGEEAVSQYKENNPDIAFIDIVMPVMDGPTALAEIKKYDSEAVLVVVSSVGTQEQIRKAIEAGARDFMQKPIDMEQLVRIINARLGGK